MELLTQLWSLIVKLEAFWYGGLGAFCAYGFMYFQGFERIKIKGIPILIDNRKYKGIKNGILYLVFGGATAQGLAHTGVIDKKYSFLIGLAWEASITTVRAGFNAYVRYKINELKKQGQEQNGGENER